MVQGHTAGGRDLSLRTLVGKPSGFLFATLRQETSGEGTPEAEEREERSWTRSTGVSRSLGTARPPPPPTFWNILQDLQKCGRVSISPEGRAFFLNSILTTVTSE